MSDHGSVLGPLAAVRIAGVLTPDSNVFATMRLAARHGRRGALMTCACTPLGWRGPVMRVNTRFQKWLIRVAGTIFVGFGLKLVVDR